MSNTILVRWSVDDDGPFWLTIIAFFQNRVFDVLGVAKTVALIGLGPMWFFLKVADDSKQAQAKSEIQGGLRSIRSIGRLIQI